MKEMIMDFTRAAFPWIVMGLMAAFYEAGFYEKRTDGKKNRVPAGVFLLCMVRAVWEVAEGKRNHSGVWLVIGILQLLPYACRAYSYKAEENEKKEG